MTGRCRKALRAVVAITAIVGLARSIDAGQRRETPAETLAAATRTPGWVPPKTAWGHPDLQGVWTSDDMRSVPTQRPDSFAGRASSPCTI